MSCQNKLKLADSNTTLFWQDMTAPSDALLHIFEETTKERYLP